MRYDIVMAAHSLNDFSARGGIMSESAATSISEKSQVERRIATTPIWLVLSSVAALALITLCYIAFLQPMPNTLPFEVAKTCLQVLGVAILGGIVTLTIQLWQEERKQIAQKEADAEKAAVERAETTRKTNEEVLERQRQQYKLRITIVHRMTRCAQTMYVVLQHIRRVQKDSARRTPHVLPAGAAANVETPQQARQQLDLAYLTFSAEAAALETEIRAWYGRGRTLPDEEVRGKPDATASGETIDPPKGTDELWHQIVDLLTVYYFALCGNFRVDVLSNNSPHLGQPHADIKFEDLVPQAKAKSGIEIIPDAEQVLQIIKSIRKAFGMAMSKVALSALDEELANAAAPPTPQAPG